MTLKLLSKNDYRIIIPCLLLICIIVISVFHPYGVLRMTYDSYDLIEASDGFDTYLTGKNKDGHSYLVRSPLHPFLLSFSDNKIALMWWINLLCLLAALHLTFRIARLYGMSIPLAVIAVTVITLFYPWVMNFEFLWTEQIFIVLILLLSYSLLRDWSVLSVIGLCVLLFLTRKAGIFFFFSVAVFYWADNWRNRSVILMAAGLLVFALWQWLELSFESTGNFSAMLETLDEFDRLHYLDAVTSWILPMQMPLMFRTITIIVLLLFAIYFFRREIFSVLRERQNVVLLAVAGVYSVIMISFSGTTGYEDAERYLNVVYPLWIIVAVSVVLRIIEVASKNQKILIVGAVGIWLLYPFLRTAHHLFWPVV